MNIFESLEDGMGDSYKFFFCESFVLSRLQEVK